MHPPDDDDVVTLDPDDDDEFEEEDFAPGPDERDMDLLDGSWEDRYYSGQTSRIDWGTVALAIALIAAISLVLPGLLVMIG